MPIAGGGSSTVAISSIAAGTNNIGDVDVLTLPALAAGTANIGDVDVLTIAAGDNNIGNVDIVTLPALVAGVANIGDVDVLTVPAPLNVTGTGLEATALRVTIATDSTGVLSVDDNAGSLTVDGTVAVSSLPALVAGVANIGDVDVLTVPAPLNVTGTGVELTALRVTIASDSTGVLSVDDNAGSLTVDGTVAVSSLPALVAGVANIGDVDVLTLPALVAGTANIGDVDVLTLPALTAGTNVIGGVDSAATTSTISNVTLTLANTEYTLALPATCRRLSFQARTSAAVRFAYVTGKVATPIEPYLTLKADQAYDSGVIKLASATLYLASATATTVVEIEQWS